MLNHSQRESGDAQKRGGGEEDQRSFVAVAIEKDKVSQATLRWAIDNIVTSDHIVKLVHVNHKSNLFQASVGVADATMELFLPFRCYCTRRQVDCEVVVLDDHDIGKALIEYVTDYGIETLVLGASKNAKSKPIKPINKIFKVADLSSSVLKAVPDFCNVYIISKGKVQTTRSAARPVPFIAADAREALSANKLTFEGATLCGDTEDIEYDDLSELPSASLPGRTSLLPERVASLSGKTGLARASRVSVDTAFFAFCDNIGSEMSHKYQNSEANDSESSWSEPKKAEPYSPREDMSPVVHDSESTSFSLQKPKEMEDEIKRLKTELKHTMEMYYTACKEALNARRKAREIQEWKRKEEEKLQETDAADVEVKSVQEKYEATRKLLEQEIEEKQELLTKLGGVQEEYEATRKLLEQEVEEKQELLTKLGGVQEKYEATRNLLEQEVEKKQELLTKLGGVQEKYEATGKVLEQEVEEKLLAKLGDSSGDKYQNLYHIVVVLFVFYFYFTIKIILLLSF